MADQKYYNDILAKELPAISEKYPYYYMVKTLKLEETTGLPYATLTCSTQPFYAKNVNEQLQKATIYSMNSEYIQYTCSTNDSDWVLNKTDGTNYSGMAQQNLRRWTNFDIIDKTTSKTFYKSTPIINKNQALIIDEDFWNGVIAAMAIRPYLNFLPNEGE